VITPTQPNVPEAKVRGSHEGFQWVLVSPERAHWLRKRVRRGPLGPPGPLELAALLESATADSSQAKSSASTLAIRAAVIPTHAGLVTVQRLLDWFFCFRRRGLDFPIYLFSPETGPNEATSLHLALTPHPTPRGGSPTPRRMLGTPIYGLGPTNGPIGPRGWVAKMGVM
jgi:hypothetical protein